MVNVLRSIDFFAMPTTVALQPAENLALAPEVSGATDEVKQLNILFVEDNELDIELLLYQFHKVGYELVYQRVDTAELFQQALSVTPWHVILCDHNMPHFDVMSALKILKSSNLDIPLIIVSGSIPEEIMVDAMAAGAQDFIRKGDFARLLPVIQRELSELSVRNGLREATENIHRLVNYDTLTGLPNREHLLEDLRLFIAKAPNTQILSLVLIRMNRLPHNVLLGDEVYKQLVNTIAIRISDLLENAVYVVSNNCLAVIVTHARRQLLEIQLKAFIENLSHPITLDGQLFFADCNVGVCGYPGTQTRAEDILLNAEIALEQTDNHGVMPLCFYASAMQVAMRERRQLESGIHRAFAGQEFFVLYQPQVDITTQQIIGVEALLRWNHPELGVVSPLNFIPLLERTGLIIPAGEWVIREACRQGKLWMEQAKRPLKVAVNLSVVQFYKSGLIATVQRALDESHIPPECLELEIT